MYRYKYPDNIDKLLDGRSIVFVSHELHFNRERLSNILRGFELCTKRQAYLLTKRCQPTKDLTDYFKCCTESEVKSFDGKRD